MHMHMHMHMHMQRMQGSRSHADAVTFVARMVSWRMSGQEPCQ